MERIVGPSGGMTVRIGLKLFYAGAAGALAFLLSEAGDQRIVWRVAVGIVVGAFALVAQLMYEAAEASRRLELARRTVTPSRVVINRLVTAATSAPAAEPLIVLDGHRADGDDDPDLLLSLTERATTSIDAITVASIGESDFWTGDLGRQYLRRQREAIERNVRIRRLFLLTERAPDRDRWRTLLEPHRDIGVETRIIRPGDIYFLRRTDLEDFIVFDQKVSYEFRTARLLDDNVTPPIASVAVVVDPLLVTKRQERFEQLWSAATEP